MPARQSGPGPLPVRALMLLAALSVSGCTTLGPDFAEPKTALDGWTSPSLGGVDKVPAAGPWWNEFHDPALNALLEAAMAGNRDLRASGLRVIEARAQLGIARSTLSPQQVQATAGAGYGASTPAGIRVRDTDFLFGTAGISAGWEIDFWGRFKRGIQGANAAYFASVANQQAFALILRAEVAKLYLTGRTLQERLAVVRANLELQRRSVAITELRFRRGDQNELDYQQARTQLLSTEASIPELEASLTSVRNGLCLLLGRPPGELPELALSPQRLPDTPAVLSADIPADILRLRPDVRAAGFRAAAQSAQIGIAQADLYPSLVLGGSFSLTRTSFGGATNVIDLGIGPSIRWNFLDFGRIRGNVRVQDARLEQALEAYQQAVLQAASEVDTAATVFTHSRSEQSILEDAQTAAARALELATIRYREGLSDFQRVLDAQAALLRQQDRLVINRGDTARDLVELHKALGGGLIAPVEADFASPETRARMAARTNWGGLLGAAAQQEPKP